MSQLGIPNRHPKPYFPSGTFVVIINVLQPHSLLLLHLWPDPALSTIPNPVKDHHRSDWVGWVSLTGLPALTSQGVPPLYLSINPPFLLNSIYVSWLYPIYRKTRTWLSVAQGLSELSWGSWSLQHADSIMQLCWISY